MTSAIQIRGIPHPTGKEFSRFIGDETVDLARKTPITAAATAIIKETKRFFYSASPEIALLEKIIECDSVSSAKDLVEPLLQTATASETWADSVSQMLETKRRFFKGSYGNDVGLAKGRAWDVAASSKIAYFLAVAMASDSADDRRSAIEKATRAVCVRSAFASSELYKALAETQESTVTG